MLYYEHLIKGLKLNIKGYSKAKKKKVCFRKTGRVSLFSSSPGRRRICHMHFFLRKDLNTVFAVW